MTRKGISPSRPKSVTRTIWGCIKRAMVRASLRNRSRHVSSAARSGSSQDCHRSDRRSALQPHHCSKPFSPSHSYRRFVSCLRTFDGHRPDSLGARGQNSQSVARVTGSWPHPSVGPQSGPAPARFSEKQKIPGQAIALLRAQRLANVLRRIS